MEGVELLKRVPDTVPKMRKIIVTGYPTLNNAVQAVNLGADAYVIKPFDVDNLLLKINEQVSKQKEEKGSVYDFAESPDFTRYGGIIVQNKSKINTESDQHISTETIFRDKEDGVDVIKRTLNKSAGEYLVEEIKIGDFENNIARRILISSYLGTIFLKNRSLQDIYYEIKKTVRKYYEQEEIEGGCCWARLVYGV